MLAFYFRSLVAALGVAAVFASANQPPLTTHELPGVAVLFDQISERHYRLFTVHGLHDIEITPDGEVRVGVMREIWDARGETVVGACATAFDMHDKRHYAFILGSIGGDPQVWIFDVIVYTEDFETVWRHRMSRQRAIALWWPLMCETLVSPDGETKLVVIHKSGLVFYNARDGEVLHIDEKKPYLPSLNNRVLKIRADCGDVLLLPSRNEMYAMGPSGEILARQRAPRDSNTINVTYIATAYSIPKIFCSWSLHSTQTQSELMEVLYHDGEIEFVPTGVSIEALDREDETAQPTIREFDRVLYSPESGRIYSAKGMGQAGRVRIYCSVKDSAEIAYRFFPETPWTFFIASQAPPITVARIPDHDVLLVGFSDKLFSIVIPDEQE